jgi:hypothetical protein
VRLKPLVGDEPWFGPRRAGWGWSPITWQGWVMTVGVLVAVVAGVVAQEGALLAFGIALVPVLIVVSVLKGTSPGGPAAWRQLQRVRSGEVDAGEVEAEATPRSRAAVVLLALAGFVLAVIVALLLLVTVAPSAIAPPASVEVTNGQLHVDVRGPYALFALRRGVTVPVSRITSARLDRRARDLPRGSRFGTYIPGGLIAGSFGSGSTKAFWALQHDSALVLTVTGSSFATLVVEVRDPAAVLRDLAAAGVPAA